MTLSVTAATNRSWFDQRRPLARRVRMVASVSPRTNAVSLAGPETPRKSRALEASLRVAASWSFWMGRHCKLPMSAPEGHAKSGMETCCEGKRKGVHDMAKHVSDGECDREVPPGQGLPVQGGTPLHPVHIEGGG